MRLSQKAMSSDSTTMKKTLLSCTLILSSFWLIGQITVSNATFPATGDTLKTATDLSPEGIVITNAGGPFDWDFTSLTAGPQSTTVFVDASEGANFDQAPTATHATINDIDLTESYFKVSNDKVEFIGASGNDPTGFGVGAFLKFEPPIIQRRAPMNFIDNNTSESDVRLAIAWDDLPPVLTDSLGFALADSIAIVIASSRTDLVDAYGTLSIPGGTYDVLREKRIEMRETRIEILTFLGWLDVTDQIPGGFGEFGLENITSYLYFSETEKEIIATVTVDSMGTPATVTFKDNGNLTSTIESIYDNVSIKVMPNPVHQIAEFQFNNIPMGNYRLKIHGLDGTLVVDKPMQITGHHIERIDLSLAAPSAYFFNLKDNRGNLVKGGSLIKL